MLKKILVIAEAKGGTVAPIDIINELDIPYEQAEVSFKELVRLGAGEIQTKRFGEFLFIMKTDQLTEEVKKPLLIVSIIKTVFMVGKIHLVIIYTIVLVSASALIFGIDQPEKVISGTRIILISSIVAAICGTYAYCSRKRNGKQ